MCKKGVFPLIITCCFTLKIVFLLKILNSMKKYSLLFLTFFLSLMLGWAENGNDNKYNSVEFRSLAPLEVTTGQGVSGAFSGVLNNQMVVAGGCNFPDTPAADGGAKVFYDRVYAFNGKAWEIVGKLPQPTAYGASVTTPKGVIVIGGFDGEKAYKTVGILEWNTTEKAVTYRALPSLPTAIYEGTAALGSDGYVYMAGGFDGEGNPNAACYRFQTNGGKAWESLPNLPVSGRIQPAAVVQNGAEGPLFLLLGGYDKGALETARTSLVLDLKKMTWRETSPMVAEGKEFALVGASALPSGSQFVVCFGGVNKDLFERAIRKEVGDDYLTQPVDWYQFRRTLILYNTITNSWVEEASSPLMARAGASVIPFNGEWVVINGETKPGVRGTEVTAVKMTVRAEFGWLNWTVLIAYLLGMVALGYYFMKREGDAEDFFKGGGRIPWWAAGISIYATMLSAITYMAYPAKAYATDWTYYPMLMTILVVSFPVIRYYLPFFRRLNVTTAYEYLERRFSGTIRLMASALFIVFMVARMALVLYLPSLALTAVTGIDIYICIVLMAIITILYCTMGGVEAVVWGDVVQGVILVGGAILAVVYLVMGTEGGVGGFFEIASADDKFRLFDWSFSWKSATFWVIILGGMANNLISYTSDQTVIQRYLTTKDEKSARQSIMMNGVMSVFVSVVFFAIGAGLYTFFKTHPAELDFTMGKNDIIFPFFMMSQLPAGVAGLLIAAIFAATMSTISSNINSVATAFSVDFYKRFRPSTTDKQLLVTARYASLLSGIIGMLIALLMATWNILSLLDFFQEILGLLSSGLGGLFLMGIFFPRIGAKAAFIGFIGGVASVFLTKNFTETSFLLYGAIGMFVSVSLGLLMSFLLKEERPADGLTWQTLKKAE